MPVLQRNDIGGIFYISATFDPASITNAVLSNQNVTVALADNSAPLQPGDIILAIPPATLNSGVLIGSCHYQSATQIAVTFVNTTAGALDPASATYEFLVFRR